ncbi:uncharacterized protein LOC131317426 [Rhododendron vialii]|uniref:uncharacterized protein LOC131317426 n=1 Tax=Rhododendron vialii TaxID=182163 RepID=UPI00265ECE16|nr:uncharacterized protein LOC131317426 [Rhododendron vialii]
MRRMPGETLRLYTERYWEVYNLIPDCDQCVAAEFFMNVLDPSSAIFRDLSRNPPKTMGELMVIIEKDCVHEEAIAERHAPKASESAKASVQQPWQQERREPRLNEYVAKRTAFTEPIYKLLSIIGQLPFFVWPTGFMGTAGNGPGMCTYHKECGHYTTQYQPFKQYLEELAAAGHLNPWIDTQKNPLPLPPPIIGNIRKWEDLSLEGPITFSSEELRGIQLPHTDALVVTIAIDKSTVQRVLVDQGSSVEVMFYLTFKSLELIPDHLRTATTLFVSFIGAPVWPLGLISLPVRAGS